MSDKPQKAPRRRRIVRVVALVLLALVVLIAVAFKTPVFISDLRTEPLGTAEAAKALLARLDAAHGGREAWRSHSFVELLTEGEVGPFEARVGFDLGDPHPRLALRFDPAGCGPFTMRLTDGPVIFAGEVGDASGGRQLLAASVRHLFEFPFAMASADVQHGMTVLDGHPRLFMSWGAAEPQMHIDQYVLWLGPDDRVVRFESTVRAVAPFLRADVVYEGSVEAEDINLPAAATVRDPILGNRVTHSWRLVGLTLGPPRAPGEGCGG